MLIILPLTFYFWHNEAGASWWNSDWFFKKEISITNNTTTENNVYISLTLDTSDTDKFQSDCGDLRFIQGNGNVLSYHIVSGCMSTSTLIHANFDVFDAGTQTIDVYYGNPTADNGFNTTDFATQASDYTIGTIGQEQKGPSPVLYLPLDEGFGSTAHDETSLRNDGTIVGATWKEEGDCKSGKCLEFDGNGDYVEIADNPSLDLSEELTLEAWIKPQSTNLQNQTIISKTETPTEPTKIYRSVGPSATAALAVGTTNAMTIIGDRATFQTALPDNVGVGDAIQYDDDNDNDIDASDSIVFIKERVTSFEYKVATASGGTPVSVNADNNWSLFRAYTSLANAENGIENTGIDADLVNFDTWSGGKDIVASNEQWNIACYANGTTADTVAVTVSGWTTGVQNFVKIYTPVNSNEVGTSQRHGGKWDNGKYNLSSAGIDLSISSDYVWVDGLQIYQFTDVTVRYAISNTGQNIKISNNVIKGTGNFTTTIHHGITSTPTNTTGQINIWNNIIYGFNNTSSVGIALNVSGTIYDVYDNTIYGCNTGISRQNSVVVAKNNIVQGATTGYNGTFDASSDYNISNDATAPGANSKNSTTVSFISTTTGSEDFHLSPTDTAAKDSGVDLSGDSVFPFNSDIDGSPRKSVSSSQESALWDIGADEAQATQIYRSVAPNKTDALETGSGNAMTITGGVASFAKAMAAEVGVGDVIQYDDDSDGDIDANDSLAFISGRVTSYEFLVTTASGGVPTQVINDNDWSLFRAYTSLANAESGTENTGIDSDLRNFDTWSGGKDIVTSKEQWNIACYANGTTADTAAVVVDGWTTGMQNFVKIYTPVDSSEVGVSQRHSGIFSDGYRLENGGATVLQLAESYLKIDGLSISAIDDTGFNAIGGSPYAIADWEIANNMIKTRGATNGTGISLGSVNAGSKIKIWNNILLGGTDFYKYGIFLNDADITAYIYNNTIIGWRYAISQGQGSVIAKNNIFYNQSDPTAACFGTYSVAEYNATNKGSTGTSGTNELINQTFSFVSTTSGSEDFHLTKTDTAARNQGTSLESDSVLAFNFDIDGEERKTFDIGADEAVATKIYRSVGPGNTSALATDENHKNVLTVLNGEVSFSSSLPDRIGVGDAVLIDTNSDNAITSADTLLFIHSRNSSVSYDLRTHTGVMPADISENDTYQIFRAYTSLANAEAGTKNTSIPVTFNGGNRDLVTNNEEWNIACYGDGVDSKVFISGWTTGRENYLNIFTPVNSDEVGISQRHNGKWSDNKYKIELIALADYSIPIDISTDFVKIDGLQILLNAGSYSWCYGITAGNLNTGSNVYVSNNIVRATNLTGTPATAAQGIYFYDADGTYHIWNNIVYDFNGTGTIWNSSGISHHASPPATFYAYNNTVANSRVGYTRNNTSGGVFNSKNNIVQNCTDGFVGTFSSNSDFNISDLATDAPGTNSKNSTTVTFRDSASDDFRLAMTDTVAKGAGLNLTYDANLPITNDIEGELRPGLYDTRLRQGFGEAKWDIGADQISSTIHNNYSLNLKTNYPQTNFSTADNDQDNFSSGNTNLPANIWSHLVYKRNADSEELFINGSKKDSGTISNFLKTNNGKLYLGAENPNSQNSFKGLLDEIRIYNYARTDNEVKKDTTAGTSGRAASRAKEGVSVAIGDKSTMISDGLVGYWKMDEASWNGTANEVKDVSGNNNHGVATGGASTTAGRFGNGGGFDGVDDGVNFGSDSKLDNLSSRSVCSWVKASTGAASWQIVFDKSVNGNTGWNLYLDSLNRIAFYQSFASSNVTIETGKALTANQWQHLCVIYDGEPNTDGLKIYLDGNSISFSPDTAIGARTDDSSYNFRAGSTAGSSYAFNGQIDETRIYNRALSPDEIKQLHNYAPGPVLHLKMDEKSGTTAFDSSGNNNNGTLVGMNDGDWVLGKYGSALDFDGSNDHLEVTQNSKLPIYNSSRAYSLAMWVKGSGSQADRRIFSEGSDVNIQPLFNLGTDETGASNKLSVFIRNDAGTTVLSHVNSTRDVFDNTWHHIEWVDNSGNAKLYIDGIADDTNFTYTPSVLTLNKTSIAAIIRGSISNRFSGSIDDVKIYNYARTQEQILEDMGSSASASASRGAGALGHPVLDLNFDEGVGSIAYDKSVNKNNGTLNSGATGGNTTATMMWDKGGKFGGAMEFDGSDGEYIDADTVDNMEEFSACAWVKPYSLLNEDSDNSNQLFDKGWSFRFDNVGKLQFYMPTSGVYNWVYSADNLTVNNWQHACFVYSGLNAESKIFLNGVDNSDGAQTTTSSRIDDSANVLRLGAYFSNETFANFNGLLDEVKIYNYALSESEIKSLYNGGSSMSMGGESATANNNGTTVTGANKEYCIPGDMAKCDKPVLELKMDEKVGTTAFDSSGNGNNGTLTGGPIWDRGKNGSAVRFDGVNDYAVVADASNLHLDDFTLSYWIKPDLWVNNARVIAKYNSYSTMDWELMYFNGLYLNIGESTAELVLPLNYIPPVGQWTYVSITKNSNNWQMFANGISLGEDTSTATWTDSDNIHIGAQDSGGPFFDGSIDDIKIYNYARTPAQIAWDYNRGKPIAEWSFNEGQGSTAHNEIENLNHGTITGATWKNESECKSGKCLYFNGQDLTRVDVDTQDNMSQFTACAWVKSSAWSNPGSDNATFIFEKGWGLSLQEDGKINFQISTSNVYPRATTNDSILVNEWYRICGAYYGVSNNPKIFINGKEQPYSLQTAGSGNQDDDSAQILRIGAINGNEWYGNYYGYIDEPKIYNYALTPEQIEHDYAGGAVIFK